MFPILLLFLVLQSGNLSGQDDATILGAKNEVCFGDSVAIYLNFAGGVGPYNAVINDKNGELILLDSIPASYTIWEKPVENNTYYIASFEDSLGTQGNPLGVADIIVRQSTPVSLEIEQSSFLVSDHGIALGSSPPGAVFSGEGVAGSLFYPGIASWVGSPHTVECTLTNEFGCISIDDTALFVLSEQADVYMVSGGDTINAICDDGATYYLKGSNRDNIPGTFELIPVGAVLPLPGFITDGDLSDDEAVLDPVGLSGGYDVIYTYGL